MVLTTLAFFALIAMVAVLFVWVLRFDKLRIEVERTIKQSHPEMFNDLANGWSDPNKISLIPRRRFVRFLRDREYLNLADSGFSEKCRTCYRRYLQALWICALVVACCGLWLWLDST
jgi:hypothetical protein